jgi:hypothetical protein
MITCEKLHSMHFFFRICKTQQLECVLSDEGDKNTYSQLMRNIFKILFKIKYYDCGWDTCDRTLRSVKKKILKEKRLLRKITVVFTASNMDLDKPYTGLYYNAFRTFHVGKFQLDCRARDSMHLSVGSLGHGRGSEH